MRVFLLDSDAEYAARFAQFLSKKTDIQVSVCGSLETAKKILAEEQFQVILFDAAFDGEDPDAYRKKMTAFAFISNVRDMVKDTETIYKYSSVSEICDQLMHIYAAHTQHAVKEDDSESGGRHQTEVISFLPVTGGAGSSTMAAAAAMSFAKDQKVLYLNLEQRHADVLLFSSPEKKSVTDIVAAFRTNYQVKEAKRLLDTVILHDEIHGNGNLDFMKGFLNIEDCLSLTPQILDTLISAVRKQYNYRYIIIDADFIIGANLKRLILDSDKLVFVSTGSDVANVKIEGIHRFLEVLEREADEPMPKKFLLLNQFYGLASEDAVARDMKIIGRFGRYRFEDHQALSTEGVISQILAKPDVFADLA